MQRFETFIHWPISAFAVLAVIGYNYLMDRSRILAVSQVHTDSVDEEIDHIRYRFALIDFLLYLPTIGILLCYITILLRPPVEYRTYLPLAIASSISLGAALGLIIWQDVHLSYPRRVNFHRSIGIKIVLSLYVLGLPALALSHVAFVEPKPYLDRLESYRRAYSIEVPNYISSEPNPRLRDLYNSLPALQLHFLRVKPLPPPPGSPKDSAPLRFRSQLNALSDSSLLFTLRFTLYLVVLYLLLRYAGLHVETLKAKHAGDYQSLGLEEDVVSRVSALAAGIVSLVAALALSGFSFGEIGIFGGLVAAGVSVALRDVLANLMAGVILTWDRTISMDDVISLPSGSSSDVGGTYGIVKAMTLRYTVVEERNTVSRLIPNSLLINSTVENWTKSGDLVRLAVNIAVDYKADPKRVRAILESVCYEVERVSLEKRPQALITAFTDSAVNFALRFWVKNPKLGIRPVLSAVYFHILERFTDEGIDIAFPQLDLHLKTVPDAKTSAKYAEAQETAI